MLCQLEAKLLHLAFKLQQLRFSQVHLNQPATQSLSKDAPTPDCRCSLSLEAPGADSEPVASSKDISSDVLASWCFHI